MKMLAKTLGKVRQLSGRFDGDSGVLNTLEGEHAEALHLLDACLGATATQRPNLYAELRNGIVTQIKTRRQTLHAHMHREGRHSEDLRSLESDMDDLLERLSELDRDRIQDHYWETNLRAFSQAYHSYVLAMEERVLPWLKSALTERKLKQIDRAYRETKRTIYLYDYPHDARARRKSFRVGIRRPGFRREHRPFSEHPALALLLIPYAIGPWIAVAVTYFLKS